MTLVPCKECGAEISDGAKVCPKCGGKVDRPNILLRVVIGLVVAFLGFGFILPHTPTGRAETMDRDEIKDCWANASVSVPEVRRSPISRCEMLHDVFVRTYRRNP